MNPYTILFIKFNWEALYLLINKHTTNSPTNATKDGEHVDSVKLNEA